MCGLECFTFDVVGCSLVAEWFWKEKRTILAHRDGKRENFYFITVHDGKLSFCEGQPLRPIKTTLRPSHCPLNRSFHLVFLPNGNTHEQKHLLVEQ